MGGNVFKDSAGNILTQRINRDDVPTTVMWLELLTGYQQLTENLLGTTGITETSGDIDIAVPDYRNKDELVLKLMRWVDHYHPNENKRSWIHESGISVHL